MESQLFLTEEFGRKISEACERKEGSKKNMMSSVRIGRSMIRIIGFMIGECGRR